MLLPLEGIRVIEVGQALAGPLAGVLLADMGADVIKIEKPDGGDDARIWGPPFGPDGETSLYFYSQNRNKRSVTLNLKAAADVDALHRLCETADILIQNLRPGVVDEIGIGPEAMLARHPRLIYCSIWAFGYEGPLKMKPGFDPLLQAYGGMMSITGRAEDPPTFCGASINDKATGMFCTIGALAALRMREKTGKGCLVDTSLFDSAVHWVEGGINGYLANGTVPKRHGTGSPVIVPYQTFDTADHPLCLAPGNDRLWARCASVLGRPDWATDPKFAKSALRVANKAELSPMITAALKQKTRAEWLEAMDKAGVPCAPVNDIGEVATSEQMTASKLVQQLPDGPNGERGPKVVGLPIAFDHVRPHSARSAPRLGEHTDEVLGEVRVRLQK
jgi:crotonobetainyl-CoA:carnitine CoA-transferase CaiB-like acyl-CoA transferase